jgi:flagellar protein FlaG
VNNASSVSNLMVAGQQLNQAMDALRSEGAQAVAKVAATPTRPQASAVQEAQPMRDAMVAAQQQIQAFVRDMDRDLNFVFDEASGYIIASVLDAQTGEVIRRMPGEELLRLSRTLEKYGNVLVNQKA